MQRLDARVTVINTLAISSEDIQFEMVDIEIRSMSPHQAEFAIEIREASIFSTATDKAPLELGEAFALINASIKYIPVHGKIDKLTFCRSECINGSLSWTRLDDRLRGELHIPDHNIQLMLTMDGSKATVSLIRNGDEVLLADLELSPGNGQWFNIVANAFFLSRTQMLFQSDKSPIKYKLELKAATSSLKGKLPLTGTLRVKDLQDYFIGSIEISSQAQWTLGNHDFLLSSQQESKFGFDIRDGSIKSTLSSPIAIAVQHRNGLEGIVTISAGFSCNIESTAIDNLSLLCTDTSTFLMWHFRNFELTGTVNEAMFTLRQGDWNFRAPASIKVTEENLPLMSGTARLEANNTSLTAHMTDLNVLDLKPITITLNFDFPTSRGAIVTDGKFNVRQLAGIAEYFGIQSLELRGGNMEISADMEFNIRDEPSISVLNGNVIAENLRIDLDDFKLRGGMVEGQFSGWPVVRSMAPVSMSWDSFDTGILVTKIFMEFDLIAEATSINLLGRSLEGSVFGGTVGSDDFAYELLGRNGYLNLNLETLDLQTILDLQEQDFESSGKISGSVPVHIQEGKLSVRHGTVTALQPGGFIRYTPSQSVIGLVGQNEQLQVVVDTMRDFNYHSLEASLEYSPQGDLIAHTALKGSNPDFENGREVHLNLNLEENLADLLKSMRLSDDVSRKLSDKARQGVP